MNPKFIIKQARDNRYFCRLRVAGGEIVLVSELFANKDDVIKTVEAIKIFSQDKANFVLELKPNDQFYFSLKDDHGNLLGRGEGYLTVQSRENGIKSVMNNVPKAIIDDTTE